MRRLWFLVAVFFVTAAWMLLQKPLFLLFYGLQTPWVEWLQVLWHGLSLDLTVAGYVTALPVLVVLTSFWVPLSERTWRVVLTVYFVLVALLSAAIFAVDLGLYGYWGFRLDASVLIYLSDPKEAMASATWGEMLRQLAIFVLYAGGMIWSYSYLSRRYFRVTKLTAGRRLAGSLASIIAAGLTFLAIRGGVTVATANVSQVYFSSEMLLNHAATNPIFSFLSSIGHKNYAEAYPFFEEQQRAAIFEELRGNRAGADEGTPRLLTTDRPNVVLVLLESFGRTLMDETVGGESAMPHLNRRKKEGIWFENFYANSYRTDRGEVAVLSGFPAQTTMSVMKLPKKSATLPSLARSLGREGYRSLFMYGGDLNFTDQASYMYATGWERLLWQKDMHLDAPTSKWGYADDVVINLFGDEIERLAAEAGTPFLAGLLTLSSHEPFDVPVAKFEDKVLNAMCFTDAQVGRLVDRLEASPLWENLLVILVADHGYLYPYDLAYNSPLRHHIPMLWLGGAVKEPLTVETYASQIDLCATLLAQLGLSHDEFDYSKNIFGATPPYRFGYWCFSDGFGVVDQGGMTLYDHTGGTVTTEGHLPPAQLDWGKAMLQTTYEDIEKR